MRILALEYSMQPPLGELDPRTSPLIARPCRSLRSSISSGPSLSGRRRASALHGVLPYFFVPVPRDVRPAQDAVISMAAKLGASLGAPCAIALKGMVHSFHDVCAVRGKAFYGFHPEGWSSSRSTSTAPTTWRAPSCSCALAPSSLGNFNRTKRTFRTSMQVTSHHSVVLVEQFDWFSHAQHSARICGYLLQFFADYNLAGMAVLRLSSAHFRYPAPVERSFVWNDRTAHAVTHATPWVDREYVCGQIG